MATVTSSNGHQQMLVDQSRRHPRWTRQETLTLIQAKDITENSPHKGRKTSSLMMGTMLTSENTEPKWVSISSYCKQQGVNREPAQCRKRWSNLLGDFKKVKAWESNLIDKGESFWIMRNDLRKERKLPVSFDREVFRVLEERELGSGYAASPMPLRAIAAGGVVSDDTNDYGDYDGDEEGGLEEEEEAEEETEVPHKEVPKDEEFVKIEDVLLSEVQEDNKGTDNMTEIPVQGVFNAEPLSGTFRESWPGLPYWNSQERGKRQRLSTDGHKANDMEQRIINILESNNKMLLAQLDLHNKNRELEREQRKEHNNILVATLNRLNDNLARILEKLEDA